MSSLLSARLLASDPTALDSATRHPFLARVGAHSLPPASLTAWLVQDIHYTRGYVRFVGGLLAALELESVSDGSAASKTFAVLVEALVGIQREMAFFEQVADEFNLQLEAADQTRAPATMAYLNLFDAVASRAGTSGLLEGLTVLWATEHCYLEAWSFAKETAAAAAASDQQSQKQSGADAALHARFIPNWTSNEFRGFVGRCRGALDSTAEELAARHWTAARAEAIELRCAATYRHVLELEARFWPAVGGE